MSARTAVAILLALCLSAAAQAGGVPNAQSGVAVDDPAAPPLVAGDESAHAETGVDPAARSGVGVDDPAAPPGVAGDESAHAAAGAVPAVRSGVGVDDPAAPPGVAGDESAHAATGDDSAARSGVVIDEASYAAAVALLLDTPRDRASIERSLLVAERLRRIYGIDTGDIFADRVTAARRAREQIVGPLAPGEAELAATAEALGLSLDPDRCANWCDNARRLALAELQKRALEQFIAEREAVAAAARERRRERVSGTRDTTR